MAIIFIVKVLSWSSVNMFEIFFNSDSNITQLFFPVGCVALSFQSF